MNYKHQNLKMRSSVLSGIYGIYRAESGKIYIGQAKNFRLRWSVHRTSLKHNKHSCLHLQRSWNSHYGKGFEFLVIEEIPLVDATQDKIRLFEREQYWMDTFKMLGVLLYNTNPTAIISPVGHPVTESTRKAIADNHKRNGIRPSTEAFIKACNTNRGRVQSPEERARRSAALTGKVVSEAHRRNLSISLKGRKVSAETITKFKSTFANKRAAKIAELEANVLARLTSGEICDYGCGRTALHIVLRKPYKYKICCSVVPQSCSAVFARLQASRGY